MRVHLCVCACVCVSMCALMCVRGVVQCVCCLRLSLCACACVAVVFMNVRARKCVRVCVEPVCVSVLRIGLRLGSGVRLGRVCEFECVVVVVGI